MALCNNCDDIDKGWYHKVGDVLDHSGGPVRVVAGPFFHADGVGMALKESQSPKAYIGTDRDPQGDIAYYIFEPVESQESVI